MTQALLGTFSLAGGCCAVSLPIAFNSGSSSRERNQVTIKRCQESEGIQEVSLSENSERSVCGKTTQSLDDDSDDDNIMSDTSKDELLNEALENLGSKGIERGRTENDEKGKAECQNSTKGWRITSGDQEVVKGYCENTFDSGGTSSKLSFLELSNEDGQKLRVCINGNQCGTGDYDPQVINTFSTKSSDEGYDLKFYKK